MFERSGTARWIYLVGIMPTMASVIRNRRGKFEIRESTWTASGPRSRTLVTFDELDGNVLAHAESLAERPFDREEVRLSALRAGAPEAERPADAAARKLLRELDNNQPIRPALATAVIEALSHRAAADLDNVKHSATDWGSDDIERAQMSEELAGFVDAVPIRDLRGELDFPRLPEVV